MFNRKSKENGYSFNKNDSKQHSKENEGKKCTKSNSIDLIDIWPSCASKRQISENQILFEKNHLVVVDKSVTKFPKNLPKPKLLNYLESYVEDQIKRHDIKENEINPVRLQIYREVFDWLIESFNTYKPLLSKIKREYERNLSALKDEIRKLEPMKEILWTIAEERDQQILNIKKAENQEIIRLKQETAELHKKLSLHESERTTLQFEINELGKSLREEHGAYRKECDARKLLIMDINEIRTQMDDLNQIKKDKEPVDEEDSIMLRMALEEAKKAHSQTVKELSDTKALYAYSVPSSKYSGLDTKYNILLSEYKVTTEKATHFENQLKILEDRFAALNQQRDFYYFKYMDLAKAATPSSTTMWDKFTDVVGSTDRWHDLSGKGLSITQISQTILEDLNEDPAEKKKESVKSHHKDSTSSSSSSLGDVEIGSRKGHKKSHKFSLKGNQEAIAENKAVLRTMIEMMCDLPPGTLNPTFDPMSLLPILTKEKLKKETPVKEHKSKAK